MGRGTQSASDILYGDGRVRSAAPGLRLQTQESDGLDISPIISEARRTGVGAIRFVYENDKRCLFNTTAAVYWTLRDGLSIDQWRKNIIRGGGVPELQEEKLAKQMASIISEADQTNGGAIEDFNSAICVLRFTGNKNNRIKQEQTLLEALEAIQGAGARFCEGAAGESQTEAMLTDWLES